MVHTVGSFDAISGKSRNDFRETDPRIQSARLKLNQKNQEKENMNSFVQINCGD